MLLIPCPHCGLREQSEFSYGGLHTPQPALSASVQAWHAAVHLRPGETGGCDELWYHEAGCERWITVRRDLASHEFCSEGTS